MFNEKFLVLLVIALIIIGPQRLPEYAENLGRWVRQLRDMAWDARDAMRAELGPEFDEVDWTRYDPRRYDPRRIVRDALLEPPERDREGGSTALAARAPAPAATMEPSSVDDDIPEEDVELGDVEPGEPEFTGTVVFDPEAT